MEFLTSKEAQRAYAQFGLRPLNSEVEQETKSQFPAVEDLWKIDYLGGWKKVIQDIYGPAGVYTRMYADLRGSQ